MGTAIWRCPECEWTYDETRGDENEGFAPGTALSDFPSDWSCPDCGVRHQGELVREAG